MQTLTRDQVRAVDRLAIEELGIPGIVLMENAARHVAQVVLDLLEGQLQILASDGHVAILCGGGNNGGDGYAIARHLANAGVDVVAYAVADPATLTGDAATNHAIAAKMGLVLPLFTPEQLRAEEPTWGGRQVLVDALLGTGFRGEVREPVASVIDAANTFAEKGGQIVAVDLPSGLDCDTGEPASATIRANVTVTFVAPKPGLVKEQARPYVGELVVADIGAPPWLIEKVI